MATGRASQLRWYGHVEIDILTKMTINTAENKIKAKQLLFESVVYLNCKKFLNNISPVPTEEQFWWSHSQSEHSNCQNKVDKKLYRLNATVQWIERGRKKR